MALDAEDLAAISKLLDEKTKGFVTTEQAGKLVGEQVTTAITAATGSLEEKVLAAIKGAEGDGDGGGNDGGKGKGKGGKGGNTSGESDEMKRHKAEMAQMTADMEAAKAAQEAATQRERQSRLDTQMGVAPQAAGVPLDRVPHASAYLRTLNNTKGAAFLGFDDNGQPQWNGVHAAGYDDVVGLKEGIAGFMKTDDGKTFLPAVAASGTGARHRIESKPARTSEGALDMTSLQEKIFAGIAGKVG